MTAIGVNGSSVALRGIGWNQDSQLIGNVKPVHLDSSQVGLSSGNISDFYDITDVIHNNGSLVLTNAATDDNGTKYDLHFTFRDTDQGLPNKNWKTTAIVGPDTDGSIQFDCYGGMAYGKQDMSKSGINITDMYFTKHGSNQVENVLVDSVFSDLDDNQTFNTNLGNVIAWTPSNSGVGISGDSYYDADPSVTHQLNGFHSTPYGTGVMVGAGTHFNYHFSYRDYSQYNTPGQVANFPKGTLDVGLQFNLFGQKATTDLLVPPVRKTSEIHYHYDVVHVFEANNKSLFKRGDL